MKPNDIEKLLKSSKEKFVPDILKRINSAETQSLQACRLISIEDTTAIIDKKHKRKTFNKVIVAVCSLLILISGVLSFVFYMESQDYTLYLDINPSVEIAINKWDKVKSVVFRNEDGKNLISEKELKGKTSAEAVTLYLLKATEKGYIDKEQENEVLISASAVKNKNLDKINKKLEDLANNYFKENKIKGNVKTNKLTKEDLNIAFDNNISPGKLKMINEIIALDSSYNLSMLKDKSVKELQSILKSLK